MLCDNAHDFTEKLLFKTMKYVKLKKKETSLCRIKKRKKNTAFSLFI